MAGRPRRSCSNPFNRINTPAPVSRRRRSKQVKQPCLAKPDVLGDVVNISKPSRKGKKRPLSSSNTIGKREHSYKKTAEVLSAIMENSGEARTEEEDTGSEDRDTGSEEEEAGNEKEHVVMKQSKWNSHYARLKKGYLSLRKDSLTCSNEKGSENGEESGLQESLEENILVNNEKYNGQSVRSKKGYLRLKIDSLTPVTCSNEEGSDNVEEVGLDMEQESVLDIEQESVLDTEQESVLDMEQESVLDTEEESVLDIEQESVLDTEQESVLDMEQESVLDIEQESVLNMEQESVLDTEQESSNEKYNRQSARLKKGYLCLRKDSLIELSKESTCSNKDGVEEMESIEDNVIGGGQVGVDERDCVCAHQKEISTIQSLMGKPTDWVPPTLYIYGEEGVGKTLTIKQLLSKMEVPYGYVSLRECYSIRVLFETILNTLSGVLPSAANKYKGYTRCDNLSQFIKAIGNIIIDNEWEGLSVYIVLDDFHKIIKMESTTMITALVTLAELTNHNLCVIMLSRMVWDTLQLPTPSLQIDFNQYDEKAVLMVLSNDCPENYSKSFYVKFLKHVWNVIHKITRNINELRYMCSCLFPIYCQPLVANKVSENDSLQLWYHFKPYCQKYLTQIYTRSSYSITDSIQYHYQLESTPLNATPFNSKIPHYGKYLLIGSYLASYNPTKCDQQFFAKKRSKANQRKGRKKEKSQEIKRQFLGPRPFTLDRLLMILRSITDEDVRITTPLLSQIPTLVTLGLIAKVSSSDALDVIKYKCLVSFDNIRQISKTVDFEIVRYLYDYN